MTKNEKIVDAEEAAYINDAPSNHPCKICNRDDLPLHYNRKCPECFDLEKDAD